jgi:hypothetical protein
MMWRSREKHRIIAGSKEYRTRNKEQGTRNSWNLSSLPSNYFVFKPVSRDLPGLRVFFMNSAALLLLSFTCVALFNCGNSIRHFRRHCEERSMASPEGVTKQSQIIHGDCFVVVPPPCNDEHHVLRRKCSIGFLQYKGVTQQQLIVVVMLAT